MSPSTLDGGGMGLFSSAKCVFFFLGRKWGRGSTSHNVHLSTWALDASVTVYLPWVEVGEGLICIINSSIVCLPILWAHSLPSLIIEGKWERHCPPPPPNLRQMWEDTLWMMRMSPSHHLHPSRGRHTVGDVNEPLPHLHPK